MIQSEIQAIVDPQIGALLNHLITKNVSLASLTSWQIGGPADFFASPKELQDILVLQRWAQEQHIPLTVLGGGSNVLISDEGVAGLVLSLKNFSGIQIKEDMMLRLEVLGGTSKSDLLKVFLKYKLPPALFLAGIPGEVGGGIVMNAGVSESLHPKEFVEITDWIEVLKPDGIIQKFTNRELKWSYRHCQGWQPGIIIKAGISWPLSDQKNSILGQVKDANRTRLSKQPLELPSCGSVFKNPEGFKAAQLIDSAGLKGYTVGEAQVSQKHANFIVNLGQAKASDVWTVITHVQKVVFDVHKVQLTTEVLRVGRWNEKNL